MSLEAYSYYHLSWELEQRGFGAREIAALAHIEPCYRVQGILRRHAGRILPRGPQSEEVKRVLAVVVKLMELPKLPQYQNGASAVAESVATC